MTETPKQAAGIRCAQCLSMGLLSFDDAITNILKARPGLRQPNRGRRKTWEKKDSTEKHD